MTQPPKATIGTLMEQRDRVFNLLQVRKTLGSFDANSEAVVALCEAVLSCLNYQITLAEQHPDKKK